MARQGRRLNTREWALAYASLGWRVFPVVRGGKKPIYEGWQHDATTDPELIARYWRSEPGPNIGLICGESFVAFDIEAAHLPALRTLMTEGSLTLPATPVARTGRGGIHVLARNPSIDASAGMGHVLRIGGVRVGELKGAGGFIVASPSRTVGAYEWLTSPSDVPVAETPEWLVRLAAAPPPRVTSHADPSLSPSRAMAMVTALYRLVATAPEGERNDLLFWASCRAAEHGVDRSAASQILLAAARQAGLPEGEARSTIASGWAR